jgi:hypothetical protein
MGAQLSYRTYKAEDYDGTREIEQAFNADRNASRSEYGRSYSGDIGSMAGKVLFYNQDLESRNGAEDWLAEKHQKYDRPKAIGYTENGVKFWMIGGWCPS